MPQKIYLDFNSTHPPNREALATARAFYLENYANSSGLSLASQNVNKRIEEAREEIASLFGITSAQVIFTSCATESNNLLIREFRSKKAAEDFCVLSSPFEHPSVSECLKNLPGTQIDYLAAQSNGALAPFSAAQAYDLITMMAVQNESGVVLPVDLLRAETCPVLVDFSQALPKLARDAEGILSLPSVATLTQRGIYLTATGHKVGAGFGAGLILTPPGRGRLAQSVLLAGGNQEFALRAGSHNTEAIIALAEALKFKLSANSHSQWRKVTGEFSDALSPMLNKLPGACIVGENTMRAPGTLLLMLPGVAIDFLIMALDREGITVSTGTSCKSRSRSPSAALMAMGYNEQQALSVIRLSFDQNLTAQEIAYTVKVLGDSIERLR